MKSRLLLFIICSVFLFRANAQKREFITEKQSNKDAEKCQPIMDLPIYHKFVRDEISYTVLNQNSNVSGLKLDIGKTELSGAWRMKSKPKNDWLIQTLEFSAGLNSDGLVQVLNNEKINTKLNFTYNFHLIPNRSAFFNSSQWVRGFEYEKCQAQNEIEKKKKEIDKDKILLFALGIVAKEQKNHPDPSKRVEVYEALKRIISENDQNKPLKDLFQRIGIFTKDSLLKNQEKQALIDIIKKYSSNLKGEVNIDDIYRLDNQRLEFENDKIYAAFKEKISELNNSEDVKTDFVIEKLSLFHTEKRRTWFTISPNIGVEPVKVLDSQNKEETKNIVSIGGKALLNFYKRKDKSLRLSRIGINVGIMNNLSDLEVKKINDQTFSKKTDSLFVLKEITSKQGYEKEKILNNKVGFNLSYEFFMIMTKKTYIPGLFLLINYRNNPLLENKGQINAEFGLVFNIAAQDNKSQIYLLPYIGFPNFAKINGDNKVFRREWFLGLKVGLPFNIKN